MIVLYKEKRAKYVSSVFHNIDLRSLISGKPGKKALLFVHT